MIEKSCVSVKIASLDASRLSKLRSIRWSGCCCHCNVVTRVTSGSGMQSSWSKEEMKDTSPTLPTTPTQTCLYINSSLVEVCNRCPFNGPGTILFSLTEAPPIPSPLAYHPPCPSDTCINNTSVTYTICPIAL
jgi:hypothetical protein